MNCLTYARVSTDKQAEKELSIPAQLQAMRQYADERGWHIFQEFVEPGVSARTANRPVLRQLLTRSRHDVDVVLVHKIDRLARNVADHIMIQVLLRRSGVRLASVAENLDDSVAGHLVEHVMAAIAEFHSANLSEETKKGMRQKVLQGGWPHLPPRGYVALRDGVKSRVTIDPVEGPLMAEAFELYATGMYSIKRLTEQLARRGLHSRNGMPLAASHLHRLLTNPFYAGRIVWKDLHVPGRHPALATVELFARVQEMIRRRRTMRPQCVGITGFPLRRVARCATCSGTMGLDRRLRWSYYRCSRQAYQRQRCVARHCNADRMHASFEGICRTMSVDGHRTLADVYATVPSAERAAFVEQVFETMTLSSDGVVGFELKPLWIRAVVRVSPLLNAA